MPTQTRAPRKLKILRASSLEAIPWLVHGFSTRMGGASKAYGGNALNLGFTPGDSRADVERNREAFLKAIGAIPGRGHWPLVTLRQAHSDLIHRVSGLPEFLVGDGLVTNTPAVLLAVETADCLPVVLVDTKRHALGVFHAGWRGTIKRIVEKGVGEMRRWFESQPEDLRAAIGPGIHRCCYEVGEEIRSRFESQFAYAADLFHEANQSDPIRERYPLLFLSARPPGHSELPRKLFLDLVEANRRQLLSVGVPASSITALELCTACRPDLLFSYRAEHGNTGRLLAVAGIRS
jgi:purine-nucleoside/S-methyl-5'-thioadenosine phosphorylase / adenosine deaminase